MFKIAHEDLLTLTKAANESPSINGRKISAQTLWRWCRGGLGGTRLEFIRVGNRVCTSREALHRFLAAVSEKDPLAQKFNPISKNHPDAKSMRGCK